MNLIKSVLIISQINVYVADVEAAVKCLKKGKAAGKDTPSKERISFSHASLHVLLCIVFNYLSVMVICLLVCSIQLLCLL